MVNRELTLRLCNGFGDGNLHHYAGFPLIILKRIIFTISFLVMVLTRI